MSELYSTGEVCWMLGATYRQLDHAIRSELVGMDNPHRGAGNRRAWALDQVIQMAVVAELFHLGVPAIKIKPAAAQIREAALAVRPTRLTLGYVAPGYLKVVSGKPPSVSLLIDIPTIRSWCIKRAVELATPTEQVGVQ